MAKDLSAKEGFPPVKEKKPSNPKGFQKYLVMFVVFFAIGIAVQHFVIEPILNPQLWQELDQLKRDKALLNAENNSCLSEKALTSNQDQTCQTELNACNEQRLQVQQELTDCTLNSQ
ncbi:MAG: hypothetical protein Q7S92_02255 [Candidatus Diapherotrites archaeon]|nr:hypothetical protein [Candidatus Diapherotrites archaeon]